jgi:hypothetical protein
MVTGCGFRAVVSVRPRQRLGSGSILEDAPAIVEFIRAKPDTPRKCAIGAATLKEARDKLDKHIKNTYLKKVQAPIGVEPVLKAWMELN